MIHFFCLGLWSSDTLVASRYRLLLPMTSASHSTINDLYTSLYPRCFTRLCLMLKHVFSYLINIMSSMVLV